jgi:hypothetical protein
MASCLGKRRSAATCSSMVYRCHNCSNVGCDQDHDGECSNQGFRFNICAKCGTVRLGQEQLLVMTPQLEDAMRVIRRRSSEK